MKRALVTGAAAIWVRRFAGNWPVMACTSLFTPAAIPNERRRLPQRFRRRAVRRKLPGSMSPIPHKPMMF